MDHIAITYNTETGKIVTVPIGQTIDYSLTEGYETVAVVPRNKVDFAIGVLISYLLIISNMGVRKVLLDQSTLKAMIDKSIKYYDLKATHIKNTDI